MIAAAVFGGYIVSSAILFKYPTLLHKQKKLKFNCRHISHRGGAGENLENTMSAYEHAVNSGTDMLEIDLQLTKDGQVVVSHDNNLFRVTGHNVNISDLNYDELPEIKGSLPVDFDGGKICYGKGDRKIPLLKEIYEKFPNLPVNIDIKTNNDELIRRVSQLTRQYNREDITIWGNTSNTIVEKCYTENCRMPVYFSFQRVLVLLLLTYSGLLPFVPLKESCLEIPFPPSIRRNPVFQEYGNKYRKALLWLIEKLLIRKCLYAHLRKRGIQTYVWVLNDERDFEKATIVGVSGIMTDYPSLLHKYYKNTKEQGPNS